ncbi:hypothetical protein BH24PSE2_BH24PSE2_15780 [soil metagenome]
MNDVRAALERILEENILPFWYPRVIDRNNGVTGYITTVAEMEGARPKLWWVQAEGLISALQIHCLTDALYSSRLAETRGVARRRTLSLGSPADGAPVGLH